MAQKQNSWHHSFQKFNSNFGLKSPILIIILLSIALTTLEKIFPNFIYLIYGYPAACIASFFIGVSPVLTSAGEILIPLHYHSINVTPSCSAYGFSCLLYVICVFYIFCFVKNSRVAYLILTIPLVYVITVITNGCRIISAYYINEFSEYLLPSNFQATLHLGVGISIFLTVLIVVTLLLERKVCNEQQD